MIRIGVLVSGGGSNLQAILDAAGSGILRGQALVAVVISNKREAFALERARKAGTDAIYLDPVNFQNRKEYFQNVIQELEKRKTDLVCLSGFLLKLENNIVAHFRNRILNIHPALLPKFGGKGLYGHFVHEAVIQAGEKESGCTVHLVDEEFDHGKILGQRKVPVLCEDTPLTLAARILKEEHVLYPQTIADFIKENFSKT